MTDSLQIKRGLAANLPSEGLAGELFFTTDTKQFYIGNGVGTALTLVSSSGEVNTASNVGVGGVGVYKQKTGVDLEFKNINAGSTKITVTADTENNEIDIDVAEDYIRAASTAAAGFMSTGDKSKLDGITVNASGVVSVVDGGTF